MTPPLLPVIPPRLDLGTVAVTARVHPDLVRRFVDLGLVRGAVDASGRLWFTPDAPEQVRRIVRLHADLALNYAGIAIVIDLLARIDALEAQRSVIR
ncbi:chaperone modulator CbpM [Curtobacterium sp. L3-7]|uniref:chaperone modulator CbpM n=1 Tax=Curtobacterium sp. L3-7 TaxID=3138787 RepID=UPI003B52B5D2